MRFGVAGDEAFHDAPHPAGAFAARGALAAGFVLVEVRQAGDGADDVGGLVHDDDGGGAEAGLEVAQRVEVHRAVDDLIGRHQRHGRAAGDDGEQIVPAAADAAAMGVDELAEGHAHGVFDDARAVHMAGDLEELGALVLRAADGGEPGRAAAQDGRGDGDRFDVVDGGRVAIKAGAGGERRLEARLALLAFQAFEHRGFFAADIGAGAAVDDDIEVIARAAGVLADEAGLVGLADGGEQRFGFADIFAADVDEGGAGLHGKAGDERAFDQLVRIVADDLAVLAAAGFRFVGVDDEVARPRRVRRLGHEAPLHPRREAGAATAAQAAGLDGVDDGIGARRRAAPWCLPSHRACGRALSVHGLKP